MAFWVFLALSCQSAPISWSIAKRFSSSSSMSRSCVRYPIACSHSEPAECVSMSAPRAGRYPGYSSSAFSRKFAARRRSPCADFTTPSR
jgi:hypothetical protein